VALWPGDYRVEAREKDGPRSVTRSIHLDRGSREFLALGPELERAAEGGPGVTESGGVFTFRNEHYAATVEGDGCVTSLKVNGVEFLAPGVDFSRGAYFFDDVDQRLLTLTAVERAAPDAVTARGDRVSARYEFGPDTLTWTLGNATEHVVFFYAVLSSRVTAVRSAGGRWAKAPVEKDWAEATWFAGPARLTVGGGDRLWGPWAGHQVWEAKLAPGQTRRVTLSVGTPSEAEATRVAEVRRRRDLPEPADREPPDRALVSRPAPLEGVRRWTLETRGLRAGVHAAAYSPDGRLLATAGWDGAVRLWQPDTAHLLRILVGHRDVVRTLAWAPDGQTLASASWDGTVRLWQPETGRLLRTLRAPGGAINNVAWSPDGKRLASAGADSTVKLWDAATGQLLTTFLGHTSNVWTVAWSPDGKTLASGSTDRTVRLWEADNGRLIRSWEPGPALASAPDPVHANSVYYLAWSPDGKTLATGVGDRVVRLWRPDTAGLLHTLDPAGYVAWSPDGKTLATGSHDGLARLWRAESGARLRTLEKQWGHLYAVAWSPDGKTLVTGNGFSSVRLWQADTGQPVRELPGDPGRTDRGDWSPDGKSLACGVAGPPRVHFWEPWAGRLTGPLPEAFWAVWSPDGRTLGSHCPDGRTRLFRADTRKEQEVLRGPTPATWALAWSPDGQTVATGGTDRTVRVWEASSGKLLRTLAGHTATVHGLAWSPDGQMLASAGQDATIRIWEVKTGNRLRTLKGPDSAAWGPSLAWSPDGKTLAAGNLWGRFTLWDVASGTLIDSVRRHLHRVSVAWSADGQTLLTAGEDYVVRFWDARDGQLRRAVPGPAGYGTFSPDRRLLASPLANSMRVWEVDTGRLLGTLVLLGAGRALLVSPEGHYAGPPGVERELVYVVETDRGQDLLAPEEFARKYGWKNDPDRVRFPAAPARRP
jgi:WD40 repeat protein